MAEIYAAGVIQKRDKVLLMNKTKVLPFDTVAVSGSFNSPTVRINFHVDAIENPDGVIYKVGRTVSLDHSRNFVIALPERNVTITYICVDTPPGYNAQFNFANGYTLYISSVEGEESPISRNVGWFNSADSENITADAIDIPAGGGDNSDVKLVQIQKQVLIDQGPDVLGNYYGTFVFNYDNDFGLTLPTTVRPHTCTINGYFNTAGNKYDDYAKYNLRAEVYNFGTDSITIRLQSNSPIDKSQVINFDFALSESDVNNCCLVTNFPRLSGGDSGATTFTGTATLSFSTSNVTSEGEMYSDFTTTFAQMGIPEGLNFESGIFQMIGMNKMSYDAMAARDVRMSITAVDDSSITFRFLAISNDEFNIRTDYTFTFRNVGLVTPVITDNFPRRSALQENQLTIRQTFDINPDIDSGFGEYYVDYPYRYDNVGVIGTYGVVGIEASVNLTSGVQYRNIADRNIRCAVTNITNNGLTLRFFSTIKDTDAISISVTFIHELNQRGNTVITIADNFPRISATVSSLSYTYTEPVTNAIQIGDVSGTPIYQKLYRSTVTLSFDQNGKASTQLQLMNVPASSNVLECGGTIEYEHTTGTKFIVPIGSPTGDPNSPSATNSLYVNKTLQGGLGFFTMNKTTSANSTLDVTFNLRIVYYGE